MKLKFIMATFAISLLVSLTIFYFIVVRGTTYREEIKYNNATSFLNEHTFSLYANYNGFFTLDSQQKKWILLKTEIQGEQRQDICVTENYVYHYNLTSGYIERFEIDAPSQSEELIKLVNIPMMICISNNDENFIYINSNNEMFIYKRWVYIDKIKFGSYTTSVAWSENGESMYIAVDNDILKVSIDDFHQQKIADGTFVFVLTGDRIGYYDKNRNSCFIMNVETLEEKEVYGPMEFFVSMDWDISGDYLLFSKNVQVGLMGHGIQSEIVEIQNSQKYLFPVFKPFTKCLYLRRNRELGTDANKIGDFSETERQ